MNACPVDRDERLWQKSLATAGHNFDKLVTTEEGTSVRVRPYLSVHPRISGCYRVPEAAGRARRAPVPVRGGAAGAAYPAAAAPATASGRRAGRGQPTAAAAAATAAAATTAAGTATTAAAANGTGPAWTAGTMMRDTALATTSLQGGPTEFHPGIAGGGPRVECCWVTLFTATG